MLLIRRLLIAAAILALPLAAILTIEAIRITSMTDAEAQEAYNFGAEAMVAHGGPAYLSRHAYQASVYQYLGITLAGIGLAAWAATRLRRAHNAQR